MSAEQPKRGSLEPHPPPKDIIEKRGTSAEKEKKGNSAEKPNADQAELQQQKGCMSPVSPKGNSKEGAPHEGNRPQDSLPQPEGEEKRSDDSALVNVLADKELGAVIADAPPDLKVEAETSEKAAADAVMDRMLMDITKKEFYYGSVALDDLNEVLLTEGDFVVRMSEAHGTEKPHGEVVVRFGGNLVCAQFKFLNLGNSGHTVTLNGSMGKKTIIELLSDHIRLGLEIDHNGTKILRAINRPLWQLKKENITLEKQIGEGAFGSVWKGQFMEDKGPRPVAVKLTKVCEENKTKMEEMLVEARLMRQLRHVNVVGFYGMVNDGVEAMIVMELVNGGSLDNHLKNNVGKIKVSQKMSYCFDVSYGLHYLHSRRMIHRDLAVRNCLIDSAQNLVKISDFGMSKQCERYVIQANERTPIRWQAPEVIMTAIYTKECDVYSMGMVFFEIFSDAVPPFVEFDNKTIRARIHDPKFRPTIPASTPPLMRHILQSLWSAEPSKRMTLIRVTQQLYKFSRKASQKNNVKKHSDTSKPKVGSHPSNLARKSSDNINPKKENSLLHRNGGSSLLQRKHGENKSQLGKKENHSLLARGKASSHSVGPHKGKSKVKVSAVAPRRMSTAMPKDSGNEGKKKSKVSDVKDKALSKKNHKKNH